MTYRLIGVSIGVLVGIPARRLAVAATAAFIACALGACGERSAPAPAATPIPPTDPLAIDTPPPDYPLELACAGAEGVTTLQLTIAADGSIRASALERGSGNAALDRLATQAVKGWRFEPATRGGRPVESQIRVPVTFNAPDERPQACFALDAGRPVAQ